MKALVSLIIGMAFVLPAMAAEAIRPPVTGVSHIGLYAADNGKSEAFYVHDLGATKGSDPENSKGTRYYFSPVQFVEILPLPADASKNRLDHIAFATPDAEAMRSYLASRKVSVPESVSKGSDGSLWFGVNDPEGNRVEFVQPPAHMPNLPANPLASRIIHVGFIVHDRTLQDSFYRDILGFRPYWYGGVKADEPTWISQQVPDGTDWLEYMLVSGPETSGIPADMTQKTAGILNHFSLGVPNTRDTYTMLWNGQRLEQQTETPKIGLDAKWQLNLIDPNGTRAEVMEFHAIGTPCCSAFTASDPQK